MSRIKKITLAIVGVFFILAFFMSQKVQAQTELSGGGEFFNGDEEITINLDIDHRQEFNGWQYVIEGDIYYALEDNDVDIFYHTWNEGYHKLWEDNYKPKNF